MEENKIGNITYNTKDSTIRSDRNIYCESFYFTEIYDEVATKKFVKAVENLVRTSKEYHEYIKLLRTNISTLNHDSINVNINNDDAPLEFHHYPLSLYDNALVLTRYHLIKQDKITTFSIAKELMAEHYANNIGLISLSETNHELAHDGAVFLNRKQIFGRYENFIEKYADGMDYELREKIKQMNDMSEANVATDFRGIL